MKKKTETKRGWVILVLRFTYFLADISGQMLDLKLPVLVEFDLGVLYLPLDLLLGFLLPKPFGGRRGLQHLMAAGDANAAAVPEAFGVIQFILEARVSLGGEHRLGRFRRHRGNRVRAAFGEFSGEGTVKKTNIKAQLLTVF